MGSIYPKAANKPYHIARLELAIGILVQRIIDGETDMVDALRTRLGALEDYARDIGAMSPSLQALIQSANKV